MRKLILIAMLAFPALQLFAFYDSYADMNSDPLYLEFIADIKNNAAEDELLASYDAFISSDASAEEKSRAEYQMSRYYMDNNMKDKAASHLAKNGEYFDAITEEGVRKDIAEADRLGAIYYVEGGIPNGMKNSDKTKELYAKYPDEVYIALNEAFRYIFTPPIAGGSSTKALRILRSMDPDSLSAPDRFSWYAGMGIALSDKEEYDESDSYLEKALSIYSYDPNIERAQKDNRRGRR